ncbi:hypothetical protein [Pseudoxanthomonas sp. J35]|uniref:hypothetical protein n=1 Tax=Pseudoxanthomonas sp. J35 TaxID=935852 RepID=UPI0012EBC837|nr:hypothetical protein [Pseudoxanthomonas sp. J35]
MVDAQRPGWTSLLFLVGIHAAQAAVPVQLPTYSRAVDPAGFPAARMIDDANCEVVSGVRRRGNDGVFRLVPHASAALYRKGSPGMPFMRVQSGEDGIFAVRFPAVPGEVIRMRAYVVEEKTGTVRYGNARTMKCIKAKVSVGEVLPAAGGGEPHPLAAEE